MRVRIARKLSEKFDSRSIVGKNERIPYINGYCGVMKEIRA
jgi:hypothetical protein